MTFEDLKGIVPNSIVEMYKLNNDYKLATYMHNNPSIYDLDSESYLQIKKQARKNKAVLEFTKKFLIHVKDGEEIIYTLFSSGYCWHFAHILQDTFGNGVVCNAYPFSHVVWVDPVGIAYDIGGVYEGEALYFIPESYFKEKFIGYRHIPNREYDMQLDTLKEIGLEFCKDHGFEFDEKNFLLFTKH